MSTVERIPACEYLPCEEMGTTLAYGPYRAEDYWRLPEGEPVELIRGILVMSPAPNFYHQTISILLSEVFLRAVRKGRGKSVASPVDVVLSDDSIVQPDLVYVSRARKKIVRQRVEGPPDVVVEIHSPSNRRRDRIHKLTLYAEHGVPEVWLVDPEARTFEFLLLGADGKYQLTPGSASAYKSPTRPELEIDLDAFWKEVAWLMSDDD